MPYASRIRPDFFTSNSRYFRFLLSQLDLSLFFLIIHRYFDLSVDCDFFGNLEKISELVLEF
ncbi:hypothetical protein LEP1GSC034_4894 [Leptospira interrogans str. 2003000735]|nr:hypothetical protein LEP1GSC034_4894 [Leptospira interrogans str. 2003000735]